MLSLTISNGISNIAGRLQFSFNLPQAAITSAGVYNASTGALIRTLWNNVGYQQGTNYGVWDGNDDSGNAVATGTNYQIKMIYHNVQYIFEGIVGNTSTAQSGLNVYHSFGKMVDMAVGGNTVYYTVGYDENQEPFGTFPVGSPQVPTPLDFNQSFTDSSSAISLVTSDATRTYWAKTHGRIRWHRHLRRRRVNGADAFYTFPKGTCPGRGRNTAVASTLTRQPINPIPPTAWPCRNRAATFLSATAISMSSGFLTRCRETSSAPSP